MRIHRILSQQVHIFICKRRIAFQLCLACLRRSDQRIVIRKDLLFLLAHEQCQLLIFLRADRLQDAVLDAVGIDADIDDVGHVIRHRQLTHGLCEQQSDDHKNGNGKRLQILSQLQHVRSPSSFDVVGP